MTNAAEVLWRTIFWVSLGATAYTYFLYPVLLEAAAGWVQARRARRPTGAPPWSEADLPAVTMVISAYNERAVLPDKIANCRALDYPAGKLTFLIGSDGSTDGTAQWLAGMGDERFRTVHRPVRRGKAAMLNRLMKQVRSEIVVFSDANTVYAPEAVRQLVRRFADRRVGAAIGKLNLTAPAGDAQVCRPEGLYWRYENRLKKLESVLGAVPTINGAIFAFRRELYAPAPRQAVTEDQVLGMKIMARGFRCVFAEDAEAQESVSTWRGELQRRVRISAGNFQSLFLAPGVLHPRCGWTWFAFVSHKLLRWLAPFFLAGMLTANLFLAGELFYGGTLLVQGLFYGLGLLGVVLSKASGAAKLLAAPRYFLTMNVAILVGLVRFLTGRQRVTWVRVPR